MPGTLLVIFNLQPIPGIGGDDVGGAVEVITSSRAIPDVGVNSMTYRIIHHHPQQVAILVKPFRQVNDRAGRTRNTEVEASVGQRLSAADQRSGECNILAAGAAESQR